MKDVEWIALALLAFLAQGRKQITRPLVRAEVCEHSRHEVAAMFAEAFPEALDKGSSARPERVRAPRQPIWTEEQAKGREVAS